MRQGGDRAMRRAPSMMALRVLSGLLLVLSVQPHVEWDNAAPYGILAPNPWRIACNNSGPFCTPHPTDTLREWPAGTAVTQATACPETYPVGPLCWGDSCNSRYEASGIGEPSWECGRCAGNVLYDDACTNMCRGDDSTFCVRYSDGSGGYTVQRDYRSCQEHITGLVGPPMYLAPQTLRAGLLGALLLYLFLGVAVVADVFMISIEVITSKQKTLKVKDEVTGETVNRVISFWNPTVANLTLLALGSSAPEILLAVIDTLGSLDEEPSELGASTIVGSAAFNLLVISAVCIISPPPSEFRKVEQIKVFMCTSGFSILAYVWMVVVLELWTPDEVTVFEALLTLLCFPLLVFVSYRVDQFETADVQRKKHLVEVQKALKPEGWVGFGAEDAEKTIPLRVLDEQGGVVSNRTEIAKQLEMAEADPVEAAKALMAQLPPPPITSIQARINASRALTGQKYRQSATAGTPLSAQLVDETAANSKVHPNPDGGALVLFGEGAGGERGVPLTAPIEVSFETPTVIAKESCGELRLGVMLSRAAPGLARDEKPLSVEFHTMDGTAEAGTDYVESKGRLVFNPGTRRAEVRVTIVEDDDFEPDETFTVHLSNPSSGAKLVLNSVLVVIVDDHLPGQLSFPQRFFTVKESHQCATVPVTRTYGSSGRVSVSFETSDGVALAGKDYISQRGSLVFEDGETEKEIKITIVTDSLPEPNENFCISLSTPEGGANMGKINMAVVTILNDGTIEQTAELVANMLATRTASTGPRDGGWQQQFVSALQCEGSVDHLGNSIPPTPGMMALHFLSVFWKVIFATIPPPKYCGGWLSFVISLFYIAMLTAVIGDAASQLGCTLRVDDLVTSITLVAVGTSLPDLLASRQAVTDSTSADAAVGNVTGSNSVNVFLGLGLPWLLASLYYAMNGQRFCYPAGGLSFSVAVFTVCAILCLTLLGYRRRFLGGELGGEVTARWLHFTLLTGLWLLYVGISTMQSQGMLGGETVKVSRCNPDN